MEALRHSDTPAGNVPSWRVSRGTVKSKAGIYMMSPVGFPGNLLPHRYPLTSHTSLKEEEEEEEGGLLN